MTTDQRQRHEGRRARLIHDGYSAARGADPKHARVGDRLLFLTNQLLRLPDQPRRRRPAVRLAPSPRRRPSVPVSQGPRPSPGQQHFQSPLHHRSEIRYMTSEAFPVPAQRGASDDSGYMTWPGMDI